MSSGLVEPLVSWPVAAVLILVVAASVFDLTRRCIPNWLTYPAMIIGLGGHVMAPDGHGLVWSAAGLALGAGLLLLPVLLGGMGAGDLKLMAAVGALTGPQTALEVGILSAFAGGVMALAVAVRRGSARVALKRAATLQLPMVRGNGSCASSTLATVGKVPYGVAIGLGVLLCPFIDVI